MSEEISHTPEHVREATTETERLKKVTVDTAEIFARLFATADGKSVLKVLRQRYGLKRLSFVRDCQGKYDSTDAAIRDGERSVMLFIEGAIELARPNAPEVKE